MQEVIKVNKLYGCRVLKGYETDRGRVYLKYGPPNTMMDRFNEMGYPALHHLALLPGGQIHQPALCLLPTGYGHQLLPLLLNSEVPGEVNNPQWNILLHTALVPDHRCATDGPVNTLESDRVFRLLNDPR
jgi:hypothetical protein